MSRRGCGGTKRALLLFGAGLSALIMVGCDGTTGTSIHLHHPYTSFGPPRRSRLHAAGRWALRWPRGNQHLALRPAESRYRWPRDFGLFRMWRSSDRAGDSSRGGAHLHCCCRQCRRPDLRPHTAHREPARTAWRQTCDRRGDAPTAPRRIAAVSTAHPRCGTVHVFPGCAAWRARAGGVSGHGTGADASRGTPSGPRWHPRSSG
jgi:hypothetical protein